MREFDLLKHIYAADPSRSKHVLIGPGDDMAMVKLLGRKLLAAVDQVVDGRHFDFANTPLELIGRKAITRSLSDIAAMAGYPVATLAAATLPPDFGEDRANALFDAMRSTAEQYDCPLIGGDLAFHNDAAHPLVCSITVLAEPAGGSQMRAITRSGAKPGDRVFVTGPLGGSLEANGLGRHLTFEPRLRLAREIAMQLSDRLHAMIDISDGLGRDASHIAERSNVQIQLDADRIPCNASCDWRRALSDGEDYELCFTAAGDVPKKIAKTIMHEVGVVLACHESDSRRVVIKHNHELLSGDDLGWQHES